MIRYELASQTDMHLEAINNDGPELRWCIFAKGKRAPIAKIIVDTRPRKVQDADYEPTAHIVNVHVRPEYRGKRLGEHLVRLAQSSMKANGFIWLTLEAEENVEHHGKLVGLYERCGFEVFPKLDHYPLEYNDEECFRKVPMRCKLSTLNMDGFMATGADVKSETSTTTVHSAAEPSLDIPTSKFDTVAFIQELKREALHVLQSTPLNVSIPIAMDWIDHHLAPGSMEIALRTGLFLKAHGHPDWMELAGYLRLVGRVQEKWTNWHTPYMVQIQEGADRAFSTAAPRDDDIQNPAIDGEAIVKSGPLPAELCSSRPSSRFIDPDRYAQEGVDEAVMTWSPNEYTYLALIMGDRCSAPKEMAQVLRYAYCDDWLNTDSFSYLEAFDDADLKGLAREFRHALNEADIGEMLDDKAMEEGRARFLELVDKYASDVRMI